MAALWCGVPGRKQQATTAAAEWRPAAAGRQGNGEKLEEGRNTDKANTVWDAQLRPAVTALNHWIDVC